MDSRYQAACSLVLLEFQKKASSDEELVTTGGSCWVSSCRSSRYNGVKFLFISAGTGILVELIFISGCQL